MTSPQEQAQDAEQVQSFESFLDYIAGMETGELGSGRYRLYKTTEGGLHLAYRPDHLGTDCHFPIPPSFLAMARFMSRGPVGALARHQARKALAAQEEP